MEYLTIETPKLKCRHLKKLTCKGTLRQVLSEFIDWRYSQSCCYCLPSFKNCCPSNLLSGLTLPSPLPCVNKYTVCMYTMWFRGGEGVWGSVGDHILQYFNTLYMTRFRTYKIATPPQTKT
jgi:hypothetical protein